MDSRKRQPQITGSQYHWATELSRSSLPATQALMTAAEQMFYLGAPLAHVVQWEEEKRARRLRSRFRR
jgi:hypothetical protein